MKNSEVLQKVSTLSVRKPLFILSPFPAVLEENISVLFPSSSDCQTCYKSKFKFAEYIRKNSSDR